MTEKEINGIIEENSRRREALASPYNPVTGEGSPLKRVKVSYFGHGQYWSYSVPVQMYEDNKALLDTLMKAGSIEDLLKQREINSSPLNVNRFINDLTQLRFKYDFEFWAYITARIQDKETKKIIPFKLNKPQLKTLAKLEKMRLAGEPIRAIILKARQWGGSTLIQIYMAWIQIIHRKNWHSVIVTDVEDQARNIRGMYSRFAKEYPVALEKIELVPFEGSSKTKMIQGRNCIVGVGSVQKPESLRSYDFAMAHLSEVGSWKATLQKSPEDLAQSIRASIPDVPLSLEVLESTAKGVGNFFHREWLSAVNGVSSYEPIFIAWFEIPRYQKKIRYCEKFIQDNFENEYVQILWNLGATLEGINWYISFKKGKNYDDWRMNNEYPSTCISKGVRIGTNKGIMPIEDCMVSMDSNYGKILKVIDNGVRETYRLITKNGYELKCTNDHLIKMKPGFYNPEWKPLCDIRLGDRIELSPPMFSDEIYTLKWSENFVNYSITITPELARFIGIFMGDGSYSGECLSIACDAQDRDFIDSTKELINNLLGVELHERLTGKNKGCCEIRVSKKGLTNYFLKLGIVERVEYGYKRRVCVPDCIWKSPDNIIAEFIKGVLETDGFNGYKSAKVVLFSSHVSFLKDIQLLLLGFGITSKFDQRETTNGGGYKYLANTLNLNGEQADLFNRKIGFLSERKINNWRKCTIRCITKRTKNILYDSVLSITPLGYEQVYDLTIENRPQFSANGILVHNCNEAFSSSDMRVFNPKYVLRARESCIDPEFIGELSAQSQKGKEAFEKIVFMPNSKGNFFIWSKPDKTINVSDRYVVSVDIGGRSDGADYSVIKVIDRYWMMYGGGPEVVATWRGHIDQDLVAWKAAQIARWYNNALLIVESNSLDKDAETEGTHFLTILDEIIKHYSNIYARTDPEKVRMGLPIKYGFQTTLSTKPMVIDLLNAALREDAYIERDLRACDELDTYEIKKDGSYGAVDGCHDDIVMTTAIGLWACFKYLPLPKNITRTQESLSKKIISEATI